MRVTRFSTLIGAAGFAGLVVGACGGGETTATPVRASTPAPTPTPVVVVVTATPGPTAAPSPTPTPGPTPTPVIVIQAPTATPEPGKGAATEEIKSFRWVQGSLNWKSPLKRGGTHTYGFLTPSAGTDPILNRSFTVSVAVNMVYNQLVRCTPAPLLQVADIGGCVPGPDLAASWQVSPDGKTWTFKLDPGATWQKVPQDARGYDAKLSNLYGRAVNADDIVHSVNYWKGKLTRPNGQPQGTPSGTDFGGNIAATRAVDPRTVEFALTQPDPFLPSTLAEFNARIVPPEVFALDGDYNTRTVGSGAFILRKYDRQVEWEAIANPNFWRKGADGKPLPYLDAHVVKVMSATLGRSALITGQIDGHLNPGVTGPAAAVNFARQCPTCQVTEFFQPNSSFALGFRTVGDNAPFTDRRARLAMAKAIDYETLVQNVHEGAGIVIPGTDPWTVFWDQMPTLKQMGNDLPDDDNPFIFNLEKARQLWAASGHKTGEKMTMIYWEYSAINTKEMVALAAMLSKNLNIEIEAVKPSDIGTFYSATGFLGPPHQQFPFLAMYVTNIGTNDSIQPRWMSADNPNNQAQFKNPRIDQIAVEWGTNPPPQRVKQLGKELYTLEIQELRRMPLPSPARYGLYSGRVRNVWQQVRGGEMFHQGAGAAELVWLDR